MRTAELLAVVALAICASDASAQQPTAPNESCPIPALDAPLRYERLHQIPTTPAHDDITHKVITPGGMVLDTPKMVAARDVLSIAARDQAAMCFNLLTYARDRNTCEVTGVGRSESADTYVFRESDIVARFKFLDSDQVRVEPVGTGFRERCEGSGDIQPAVYKRRWGGG